MHSIFRFFDAALSSFSFNRLSSKLVGVFFEFGIVPMFVHKDFVLIASSRAQIMIYANSGAHAHFGAYLRDRRSNPEQNPSVRTLELSYPKEHAYQF